MIKPKILYNNVLRGITPTWSGTTVTEKPPANATDWFDWTLFEADSGFLAFTMAVDTTIDTWAVYTQEVTTTPTSIKVQYESAPSVFTDLDTEFFQTPKLKIMTFSEVTVLAGRRLRFQVTTSTNPLNIRQLFAGQAFEFEQGAFTDMVYPSFVGGVKTSNVMSVNGSIIGRSVKRLEREGMLKIDYLTASWMRSNWDNFANHASRYSFFYQPNSRDYPDDVAFASVKGGINSPTNMGVGDRMAVNMKLHMLVAE